MVVEGVYTTKSVYNLAKEHHIDMPITTALYRVLFENQPVDESVKDLMGRGKRPNKIELLHFLQIYNNLILKSY